MSDPEAMRQVQSLGKQLGLGESTPAPPPAPVQSPVSGDMMAAFSKLALRPFLSGEKLERLNSAQKLLSLIRMIPLLKDSGLFL